MATLAALLKQRGHDVRGSDQHVYPPMSDFLAAEGIPALRATRPSTSTSDLDLVVVGNAISRGNPELEAVLDRRLRHCSLPEAIRDHFLWGARSIVIAGTHGKTTTTSLAGWLLTHGGVDPTVLVGGIAATSATAGRATGSARPAPLSSKATNTTARSSTRPPSSSSTCPTSPSSTTSSSITPTSMRISTRCAWRFAVSSISCRGAD